MMTFKRYWNFNSTDIPTPKEHKLYLFILNKHVRKYPTSKHFVIYYGKLTYFQLIRQPRSPSG